jgi:hydrogenase maturation protein HypF
LNATANAPDRSVNVARRRIRVHGIVQGVGFRPFVYRLATSLDLAGAVRNDGAGVSIDVQGAPAALESFVARLRSDAPPLACVDAIETEDLAPDSRGAGFVVEASEATATATAIGPDTATCEHCLQELFTPQDRRWRYPFINCTDCGPRYTITRGLPYDRALTSLAPFRLCPACQAEYVEPGHRRFHAEATACPVCGPKLRLVVAPTAPGATPADADDDPIRAALRLLQAGAIVAIKGLGGFHLACDARNPVAIGRLRERKHREEQPLAIMALNVPSLEPTVEVVGAERRLLESRDRPIVLLQRQHGAEHALPGIADGLARLGVMLPYTPIHYLLFHEAAGRPEGTAWLGSRQRLLLVMTSANVHGDPLVIDDAEAQEKLAGIADAWLLHDRAIVTRCDDSVIRVRGDRPQFVRRARGAAPKPIRLASAGPAVLSLGGHYKVTACLTRGDEAFVSPHVGDLDAPAARRALDATVTHLLRLVDEQPALIAHDLHPDFYGTRLAARLAAEWDVPTVAVQHHHAHVASVLAEHHVGEPTLGLALDGVGYGTDGGIWGGELLLVDGARCDRLGHLRELALAGGDRAAREPWRMAAAVLHELGRGAEIRTRFARQPAAPTVAAMLEQGRAVVKTSSTGRWFDAAAGLLGIKPTMTFEGQAAMLFEGLAAVARDSTPAVARHRILDDLTLDLLPLVESMDVSSDPISAAARFHLGFALALADWVELASRRTGLKRVACGGGCFLNEVLSRRLRAELAKRGIEMLEAEALPPNDGGLSLGQCWVAQRSADARPSAAAAGGE